MTNSNARVAGQVAELAAGLYDKRLTYEEFLEQLPPVDLAADDSVTELLDLIEHEPARGGVLGVSAAAHDAYVLDIRQRIAKLREGGSHDRAI